MAQVRGEINIARPVEVVFDVVADERNEPRYNRKLLRAQQMTDGPIAVGTRFRVVHTAHRRPIDMEIEITEYDRPRHIGSRTTTPAGEVRGGLTFEPVAGGTRMRWHWDIRPTGVARLLGPLVGIIGGRQERDCWKGLKCYLEQD